MIQHLIFWSKSIHCFIQPDIAASGGLSEFLKISAIASTFGVGEMFFHKFHPLSLIAIVQINDQNCLKVNVVPHVWGSAVGLAAGLHAVATLPLSPYTAK